MIEAAFLDLMPSTVTVYPKSAADAYGKVTHSASGTAVKCRVMETGQLIATADQENIYEQGRIIFYGNPTINHDSKIVLPDGSTPMILSIVRHDDDTGAHHTTVSFGGK